MQFEGMLSGLNMNVLASLSPIIRYQEQVLAPSKKQQNKRFPFRGRRPTVQGTKKALGSVVQDNSTSKNDFKYHQKLNIKT